MVEKIPPTFRAWRSGVVVNNHQPVTAAKFIMKSSLMMLLSN